MPNFLRIFCIFVKCNLQILLVLLFFIRSSLVFTNSSNYSDSNPANATCVVRFHNCEKMFFHERVLQCTKQIRFFSKPQNENHLRISSEAVFYSQARQPQTQDARTGSNAQVTSKPVIRHQNSIKRARPRQGNSRCFASIFCASCAVYASLRA